jgi:predicted amino acid dehydrogenase
MLTRPPRFTYDRLVRASRMAAAGGAQILGLGAFTKVVGDAGVTVAREAPIPVTTGNSLTVAATLETAKVALQRMGMRDLTRGRAMVVGATGAIGSVCSRLIAQAVGDLVLVSIEPERLRALKATIEAETPGARVAIALETTGLVGDCDLVITATSAFGQRVLDLAHCKPGAVVCDVALPSDISAEEAAVRPDILVVESGEVVIPGPIRISHDIGLPPGVAYACLAESALLAMEGTFECFTLGRDIEAERVKQIYRLFRKHDFGIAALREFGRVMTEADFEAKRAAADRLLADPELRASTEREAAARLVKIPPRSKGVAATTIPPNGLQRLGGAVPADRLARSPSG